MRRGATQWRYPRKWECAIRSRLGDESGIALVLALLVMFVLTSLLATSIVLTSGGQRHAQRSNSSQRSDALAESGLNNALAQLNAHYPTDGSTVPSSSWCSSPAPQSYDNGTVTWSCTYDPATTYWTLSGVGTRKSTGGGGNVVRTAKARIKVNQQLDAPSGDTGDRYGLVSGDPNAACTTLGGGVSVNVSIYAASCLILTGNSGAAPAKVWEHRVAPRADVTATTITRRDGRNWTLDGFSVGQRVLVNQVNGGWTISALSGTVMTLSGPPLTAGTNVTTVVSTAAITVQVDGRGPYGSAGLTLQGGMTVGEASPMTPVKQVSAASCTPSPCGAANGEYALSYAQLPQRTLPAINTAATYAEANWSSSGPNPVTCSIGSNPFDDNNTRDNGLSPDPRFPLALPWASSFDCIATKVGGGVEGRLKWDAATKIVNITGKVFIDGDVLIGTHTGFAYGNWPDGTPSSGTIYVNGTVDVQGVICGPGSTWTPPETCTKAWDPNLGVLLIVACNANASAAGAMLPNYVDPSGDGAASQWTKNGGATAALVLADGVRQPTAPNTATNIRSVTVGQQQDVAFSNSLTYSSSGTYKLQVYGSAGNNARLDLQVSNNNGTSWQTLQTGVIGSNTSARWVNNGVNLGAWITNSTQLNQLLVRLVRGGSGSNPVEVDAIYVEATLPGPATSPATSFTLASQSIFEAGAWAIGNGSTSDPAFSSTGQSWLGGSVFTNNGFPSVQGGGVIRAFLSLPDGAPSGPVLPPTITYNLDSSASEFG